MVAPCVFAVISTAPWPCVAMALMSAPEAS
jgi:hypothetical protein